MSGPARRGQPAFPDERGLGRDRDALGQVREVLVVGHLVEVQVAGEPGCQLLVVAPRIEPARGVGLAVVGQDLGVGLALDRLRRVEQVAELTADLQAALGHDPRRDRRVVVRREVEVVGQRDVEAARARLPDDRYQEARLALAGQRELDPGRVEDRHAHEVESRIVGDADLLPGVDLDRLAAQEPVLARRDARRHAGLQDVVAVGADEGEAIGIAAHTDLAHREARVLEIAGLGVALVPHLRAGDPVVALPQRHVALAVDLLRGEVVGEPVGEHGLAPRSQLDAAARLDAGRRALEPIGAQEDRRGLVAAARRDAAPRSVHRRPRRRELTRRAQAQHLVALRMRGRRADRHGEQRGEREPEPGPRKHSGDVACALC